MWNKYFTKENNENISSKEIQSEQETQLVFIKKSFFDVFLSYLKLLFYRIINILQSSFSKLKKLFRNIFITVVTYLYKMISKELKIRRKFVWIFIVKILFLVFLWIYVFAYKMFWEGLPTLDAKELKTMMTLNQTSIITDHRWHVLYKLYEEDRKYIEYNKISQNMINATIAIEDKRFWTNWWLDYIGILSVTKDYITKNIWINKEKSIRWASTISQQLVKNLLLSNDKTIVRKVKERILTFRLYNSLEQYIVDYWWPVNKKELSKKRKEIIIELYLNMVFLWDKNYGVEIAAQSYFNKSAKNLNILESAILAGIIKAPSSYSIISNKKETIWNLLIKKPGSDSFESIYFIQDLSPNILKDALTRKFNELNLQDLSENSYFLDILGWEEFIIKHKSQLYTMKYLQWRKDSVLIRMYEDGYIDEVALKKNIVNWFGIKIWKKEKAEIKFPHFVFWIQDFITSNKEFEYLWITKDSIKKWWYIIQTSLDPTLQRIAMKTLYAHKKSANANWANNRSLIYIDSIKWDVLAYVWSLDYNNEWIEWEVDMIQAPRQPWSTIKPLIYAYMMENYWWNRRTKVLDSLLYVGRNRVDNFDFGHKWKISVTKALAWSRNTPLVRIFLQVWETALKKHLQSLWLVWLDREWWYWFGLALGAWEVPMTEMAQAYSHLSAFGEPAELNPILKITTKNGEVLYEKKYKKAPKILSWKTCNEIRQILSNPASMPPWWAKVLKVWWFTNATKSWTSNIWQWSRDGWLVLYTRSKVAIAWAWRTDAKAMNWYGGKMNAPVLRDFFATIRAKWYSVK